MLTQVNMITQSHTNAKQHQDRTSCNFSFSGLKTAVRLVVAAERVRCEEEGSGEAGFKE
jgi:tRNA A37 threonylcarbamoyltransferase TsaD